MINYMMIGKGLMESKEEKGRQMEHQKAIIYWSIEVMVQQYRLV